MRHYRIERLIEHFGLPLDQVLLARREGLEPEEVLRWLRPLQKLKPPFFGLVTMPSSLGSRHKQDDVSIYNGKLLDNPEKAQFILAGLLKGLKRSLKSAAPAQNVRSTWSDYMVSNNNYSSDQFAAKQEFVHKALQPLWS